MSEQVSNIIKFIPKPRNTFGDDIPENAAFVCPTCETCFWHLRMDYKCECQNGHVFDWIEWDILEIKGGNNG